MPKELFANDRNIAPFAAHRRLLQCSFLTFQFQLSNVVDSGAVIATMQCAAQYTLPEQMHVKGSNNSVISNCFFIGNDNIYITVT